MMAIGRTPSGRGGRRAGGRAFTLVEILATMALLAIVLPSTMTGISLCLSTADAARRQAEASTLAHGKLMDLLAEGEWQFENLSGDFGEERPDYRWTALISAWDVDTLRQLDVTVLWQQRGVERSCTLTTLIYVGGEL